MSSVNTANIFDTTAATRLRRELNDDPSGAGIKDVAQQFESLFVQLMLKSMRQATPGDDLFSNAGSDQYQDLYDQQLSVSLGQSAGGGLGIAAMVERQLRQQAGLDVAQPVGGGRRLEAYARLPVHQRPEATAPAAASSGSSDKAPRLGGKGHGWDTPDAFITDVWPAAERTAARLGTDPRALVAQAALETGWGKHVINRADGSSSNNLFGIKADAGWDGERVRVPTLEYRNGIPQREMADFRAYDSLEDSFEDYLRFLETNPRYQGALAVSSDAMAYTNALQQAGYATDPRYAWKIQSIMGSETLNKALPASNAELKNPDTVTTTL